MFDLPRVTVLPSHQPGKEATRVVVVMVMIIVAIVRVTAIAHGRVGAATFRFLWVNGTTRVGIYIRRRRGWGGSRWRIGVYMEKFEATLSSQNIDS